MRSVLIAFVVCGLAAGCGVDPVTPRGDDSFLDHPDGGAGSLPPPEPRLEALAERVPFPIVALRGSASRAHRVVVEEGGVTTTERVRPDGTFCVDAPLDGLAEHTFVIWSQNEDGELSERAATVQTRYDPSAPRPPGASLCDGADPAACTGSELCGNGVDDDCNGKTDAFDPVCSDCPIDILEPNDSDSVSRIEPGVYEELAICGGDRDFHPLYASMGQEIVARIRFSQAEGDLDARLIDIAHDRVLVDANSSTDDETLRWEVTQNGTYAIEVYAFGDAENTYTLELEVR